jgi:hypothetical protein
MLTFDDAVRQVSAYLAKGAEGVPDAKRVVLNAYRELSIKKNWLYYQRYWRLVTSQFISGTLSYTQATLTITLDPGQFMPDGVTPLVFPPWSTAGTLMIANTWYNIVTMVSNTVLILSESTNPGMDLPTGTSFMLYQDIYPLPADFHSVTNIEWQQGTQCPAYCDVEEFSYLSTLLVGPAAPYYYTIYGSREYIGLQVLRFYPPPDQEYPLNVVYNAHGKPLQHHAINEGFASIAINTVAVTGTNTMWTEDLIGAVFRFSRNNQELPTGWDDLNPAPFERVVVAVNSQTSITLDQASPLALTNVKYQISDPVDIRQGSMETYFFRECEKQARLALRSKPTSPEETQAYHDALEFALGDDAVYAGTRVARQPRHRARLLREYPPGPGPYG